MDQLCGPGGDAESGLHHWLILAQCYHSTTWDPDGQVWATPNSSGGQVMGIKIVTNMTRLQLSMVVCGDA